MLSNGLENIPFVKFKSKNQLFVEFSQPLLISARAWMSIFMNFTTGFPKSNAMKVILVVVDRLTKYAHFITLLHSFDATKVAEIFMNIVVRLHGWPIEIILDCDTIFMNVFGQV